MLRENDSFIVRCEREGKKSSGEGLYEKGFNRGKSKEKGYQGRGKSQGRNAYSNKKCYICKKMEHIQIMCKKKKEDHKKMKSLRDGGRKDFEDS